jgi:hypothetical protein
MAIFNSPHPLLDNSSGNFKGFYFNVELSDCKVEDGIYIFHLKAQIDEDNILSLIDKGLVAFAVKIENKPYFVKSYKADQKNPFDIVVEIPYESISSEFNFEIKPLLVTNSAFVYQNSNADAPMCDYNFNLSAYQIIGSHSTLKLSFERGYRKITSGPLIKIVKLNPPNKPKAGTMDIKLNEDDFIQVCVSDSNYTKFIAMNTREPKLLDSLITLPVLQYALSELLVDEELREKSWAKMLDEEFDLFPDMNNQESVLMKCDEILKSSILSFMDYFDRKYLDI